MPSSVQYSANNLDPEAEHTLLISAMDMDTDSFVVFDSIMCVQPQSWSYG